jgi:predicted alpha/beta-hydrolase family hydrolase
MIGFVPAGLVLTPGASAGRDQSGLVVVDQKVTQRGIVVERVEFPGQAAGKRRTDPPAVCIATVRTATADLAEASWLTPDDEAFFQARGGVSAEAA